jgi:hypothetical protein
MQPFSSQSSIPLHDTHNYLPDTVPGRDQEEESSSKNALTIVGELLLPAAPCVIYARRIRLCLEVSMGKAPFPQTQHAIIPEAGHRA